ncbi:RND transporter MFP subunit [Sulfurifustis variabilis]|uniref:RND transporter MFP subunit n=1 Tax=Sulfurifustis variabilis TaxID=1675686 RepID=A0A1B4V9R1_9GAMM|nr:efflux RND transporter periplasmic adaptor subunit [Sulfurifustis variabilis]BAU50319.1 RND transporter MFP subunit [Sulfurifustis variabilis]
MPRHEPTGLPQGRTALLAAAIASAMLAVACQPSGTAVAKTAPPAPTVSVAEVVQREVVDWEDYTGRLEAVKRVEVRPRVSGYVLGVHFTEGAEVRKGQLLFQIDPRPFQAEVDQARAELERARSQQVKAKGDLARGERLLAARAISREEYDQRTAASREADAAVRAADAALEAAALNLEFTRITAPIAGRVSRAQVVEGNLVAGGSASAAPLTTIVSLDPIYAYFDIDERAFLRHAAQARNGAANGGLPVALGLGNEAGHPHEGRLDFVDNRVDPETGTIRARGVFRNADRRFTPGMFVRVKLPLSERYPALLVNERAIGTDQSNKFVLVLDESNAAQYRAVKLGPAIDGMRVVREGLQAGERVVVNGLQRVRPGMPVAPEAVSMLNLKPEGDAARVARAAH